MNGASKSKMFIIVCAKIFSFIGGGLSLHCGIEYDIFGTTISQYLLKIKDWVIGIQTQT
jgi:hypothetical protein